MADDHLAEAQRLADTFADTWNRRDSNGYGKAYWPDAELVDPTGSFWEGRDAIAQMHVDLWNGPASNIKVEARVRHVRVIEENVFIADLEIDMCGFSPPPPGAAMHADRSVKTRLKHVVERRDGRWRIAASQNRFDAMQPKIAA